jgi:hypothetical protein
MQPIIKTQINFIAYAQKQYAEAINAESSSAAEFWLGQMHHLCQQLHWLEGAAGPPMLVSRNSSPEQLQPIQGELFSPSRIEVVKSEPAPKPKPTTYAWGDGFEGVTLDNAWDDGYGIKE